MRARAGSVFLFGFGLLTSLAWSESAWAQDLGAHFKKIKDGIFVYASEPQNSNCTIILTQDGNFPTDVYIAGGHLEMCLAVTINDVLQKWAKNPGRNLTMSFFMDGIFSNGKDIEEKDPYYKDYMRFMQIVNYSRPAGEYFPKLTLLETMGVIVNETRQYDYLTRVLPRYDRTLSSDYRVELSMSGARPKLLQPGKQGFRIYNDRQCLDKSDAGMPFHSGHEPHDGVARHQAVGIEYDHVLVTRAEAPDPVFDIAGFPRGIFRAVTIKNVVSAAILAKPQEAFLFRYPDGRARCVAQHKPVEP